MRKKRHVKLIFALIIVDVVISALYVNACGYVANAALTTFSSYTSTAVYSVLGERIDETVFSDIYAIKTATDGRVTFIGTDALKANRLSYEIASETYKKLNEYVGRGIDVPAGAFTGVRLLSGTGAPINVKLITVSSVRCSFSSTVESVGINQARQRLYLIVEPQIQIITAGRVQTRTDSIEVVCYDNLIVGDVPKVFFGTSTLSDGKYNGSFF